MVKIHGLSIIQVQDYPSNPHDGMLILKNNEIFVYPGNGYKEWKQLTNNNVTGSIPGSLSFWNNSSNKWEECASVRYDSTINGLMIGQNCLTVLKDIKPSGTNGGTFTNNAWRTRILNSILNSVWCNLSNNRFTLNDGVYYIHCYVPAFNVGGHMSRLQSITGNNISIYGTSEYSSSTLTSWSKISYVFEITQPTIFEIQHRCKNSRANTGFGNPLGINDIDETFTTCELVKLE